MRIKKLDTMNILETGRWRDKVRSENTIKESSSCPTTENTKEPQKEDLTPIEQPPNSGE